MNKKNFPAVQAKSPSEALKMLGIDEGAILEYSPISGMYVIEGDAEEGHKYSYFAEAVGFSKKVIDLLIETGAVEELLVAEDETTEKEKEPEVEQWDKADLTMVCGRCGTEEKVTEAIGGATLFMPTTSQAETRLVCTECGNTMALLYRNGAMMTDEEKAELKTKQEEAQRQQEEQRNKVTEVPVEIADQPLTPDEVEDKPKQDEPQEKSK